ncbi:MAG: ATP-grasp domain-containing protein [Candidatus Melainabacteria bacterium]|nr:ATP-grasp domain-containing protein [Candidatus Melainabacteria bacterium]
METSQLKRDWRHWTIAVTGVNAHAENPGPGMAVARCLIEHPEFKGRVIGLAYDALDAGLYARQYFTASYLLPYPSSGDEVLMERLMGIHDSEQIDAIIPCLDSELPNFIRLRGELAQNGIKMLIPSRDQFTLRAKDHLVELCQSADIPVPRTKVLTDPSFFDRVASAGHSEDGWRYPLVLKGIFYDATMVNNSVEAKSVFCKLITKWGYPCLVQELIKGDELNLAGLGDGAGNLVGHVTMRKRAITEKGKAWAGVTIIDEAMLETAQRLVKALSWRGPLEVEAIRGEDGRIFLIEINPRFPSWIYLSQAVNRNLPIAVLKLLDKRTDLGLAAPTSGYFFIRHAQELVLDLSEFESVLVNGRSGPVQNAELRAIKEKSA